MELSNVDTNISQDCCTYVMVPASTGSDIAELYEAMRRCEPQHCDRLQMLAFQFGVPQLIDLVSFQVWD